MAWRIPPLHPAVKYLLALPAAVGLYALLGGVGVPWLLRSQLAQWTARHPEFTASLERISYNPFSAKLTLRQLDLAAGKASPLRLQVEELSADVEAWASLRGKRVVLGEIRIMTPSLEAGGDASALAGLLAAPDGGQAGQPVRIDRLVLERGRIRQQSNGGTAPLWLQLEGISFQLEHFASDGDEPAYLQLEAQADSGAKLSAHASLTLAPLSVDAAVFVDGLPLQPLWRRYLSLPALALKKGAASLATPIAYRGDSGVVIGPGKLRLQDLELQDTAQQTALLQAPAAELRRVTLDLRRQRAEIDAIEADKAQAAGWLAADGALNYAGYATGGADGGATPAWRYRIGRVALTDAQVHFQDRSRPDGPTLALAPLSLTVGDLGNDSDAPPFKLTLDGAVNGQGRLQASVAGSATPGELSADIKAEQIELTPLGVYLKSIAKVELADGDLDLAGHLDYRPGGTPQLQFTGEAAINRLAVNRQDDDLELLKWRSLTLKGLSASYLPPGPLHIAEIVADQPYARIVIEADKTLNWAKLAVGDDKPSKPGPAFPIAIDALRIRDGQSDFADRTLRPEFAATIHRLEGDIKGLSSSPDARAALLLEGQVDQYAPVRVQGLLNPFRAGAYTDIEMHFHNVDLTRLSPYSGKFAGYRIDKGKLTLDLRYRLENRKLEAENQVVMDHLTLGERVESKTATSLPIGLAIALLRDTDGKIDIHLPISGNLDDPKFSLRDLYAQAITGLITKLVSSPFTVLGNLLEGDPEEYGRVAFFPGKALLSVQQKEKLLKLAGALQQRSGLTLEIRGVADPERDRSSLAEVHLQNRIRHQWRDELRAKGEVLTPERKREPIPEADYKRLLLAQYGKLGLGVTQDTELARQALLAKLAVSDTDLRLLAQRRAERIREFLVKDGGIGEQRVYLLDVLVESEPGRELESRLLLNGS